MLRTIMVPLDGSSFGEWALPRAIAMAERTGATLNLVTVHIPFTLTPIAGVRETGVDLEAAAQRGAEAYLASTASRIAAFSDVSVTTTLRCGMVQATLLEHAAWLGADLIVMTTHGRGQLQRMWLGSVADGVVRHAARPVLLVRPEEGVAPDPGTGKPFEHVMVPLDGSVEAEAILGIAAEMLDLADAECTAVRVVQPPFVPAPYGMLPPPPADDRMLHEMMAAAQAYLDEATDRLRKPGRTVEGRVLMERAVAPALLAEAERCGCDLIALATHGRGPVGRMLIGSVADKIVRGAHTAVLLCRPERP